MTGKTHFDTIVLGSGFGGSLLALLLQKQGLQVAMLDTQKHPRFAIGESSTPIADLILHQLVERYEIPELRPLCRFGLWQKQLPQLICGCKRGFTYLWHGDGSQFVANADHSCELLVAASSSRDAADTHWYRADVDRYFADVAEQAGVARFDGIVNLKLDHPSMHEWNVGFRHNERECHFSAPFLIDASGPAATVLKFLSIGSRLDQLHTHSRGIFSHFTGMENVDEWLADIGAETADYPYPPDDAAVHHLFNDGWWWQLRFENGITSFGFAEKLTSQQSHATTSPEERWNELLASHPPVAKLLRRANRHPMPGRIISGDRLQRLAAHAAGADWAALPNTVGFIDPLHSTGIAQTLRGVEALAGIIPQSEDRDERLAAYECEVFEEFRLIDRIVAGCYAALSDFSVFTTWSMTYFAAATCYEQSRLAGERSPGSFLNAAEGDLLSVVSDMLPKLQSAMCGDIKRRESFIRELKDALQPYNRVGLFAPAKPNMYHYTACEKPA